MATEKKTCRQCRWHMWEDYGYSNYTTEGSYFHCLKKLHPEDGFDEFYGEDVRLDFAKECPAFEIGDGVNLDCDLEGEKSGDLSAYTDDPEVAALLNAWNNEPVAIGSGIK